MGRLAQTLGHTNSAMPRTKRVPEDEIRENRILFDVVVDAYDESERAMGWYYYLQDKMQMPFPASCSHALPISKLQLGQKLEVLDLAPEELCMQEVFVNIKCQRRKLCVPLSQVQCESNDKDTQEAVADWHYWLSRGYGY